jgi:carboxyl-terminal processing protease
MQQILHFMKRNYKYILLILVIAFGLWSFNNQKDPFKNENTLQVSTMILEKGHYKPRTINDEFSMDFYDDYIDAIDPSKRFFTEEDINELNVYYTELDNQIKNTDLTFFNLSYDLLHKRIANYKTIYTELLAKPFDYTKEASINTDYDKLTYAKNEQELLKRWKKSLQLMTIARIYTEEQEDNEKAKDSSSFVKRSFEELEKKAREGTRNSMEDFFIAMFEQEKDDYFAIYNNTLAEEFDPHTSYFSPRKKKQFDAGMSGKIIGIGARLQKKKDYIHIMEVIPGGPAWKSKKLESGDIILKVAQGNKEPLDVVAMRLDKAIEFIKGKENTEVRLTIKKIDGSIEIISLIREVIELEATFAKSAVIVQNNKKIGLINLPGFYTDFSDKNRRTAASDLKKEIIKLKKDGIEGLILDLRNNGGGSLRTAIDIGGFFIDKGPIVQTKYRGEAPKILKDNDPSIIWDGSLVILVNEFSASASEILAAAMQDYKRAIIIGSKQTFGKGTVQRVIDLNAYASSDDDLGSLKLTIQKFYRINGGATQIEGVKADIRTPDRLDELEVYERDMEDALKHDFVPKASYEVWNHYLNYDEVIEAGQNSIDNNSYFKLIRKNADYIKAQQNDFDTPLSYTAYKADIEKMEQISKQFDTLDNYKNNLIIKTTTVDLNLISNDTIQTKKRENWHKELQKDMYLNEAVKAILALRTN